jgi:tetratricopeptide (TPR) repeat protein
VSPGLAGETPQERKMDLRLGLPLLPADTRIGIRTEGSETGQTAPPEAGGPAAPAAEGAPAAPADLYQSPLYWRLREAATTDKAPARGEEPPFLLTTPKPRTTAAGGSGEERNLTREPQTPAVPPLIEKLPTTPASYADFLARAQAAVKANQYGAADSLFQAAIVMAPDQPEPFFGRVNALLGDYRYLEAALVLDRGLKEHPEWARSIPDAKAGYSKSEVYDRIVGELAEDLKNHPQSAETNLLLGYLSLASGKTEDAKAYLKQVAQVRGDRAGSERAMLDAIASPGAAK